MSAIKGVDRNVNYMLSGDAWLHRMRRKIIKGVSTKHTYFELQCKFARLKSKSVAKSYGIVLLISEDKPQTNACCVTLASPQEESRNNYTPWHCRNLAYSYTSLAPKKCTPMTQQKTQSTISTTSTTMSRLNNFGLISGVCEKYVITQPTWSPVPAYWLVICLSQYEEI